MSTQILGTIGTAVGTAVGGPVGGFIGGQVGSGLGARLGGSTRRHYEGPRLEELAVQTSTYGKAIPKVWGSVRLAGNVLWSRPIKEVVTTTTTSTGGGKGAGGGRSSKTTQSDYRYYVTLAIGICEGEITRIDRVWADAKLLDLSLGTYRLYRGSEEQMPDALIESYEGVGQTPAYRGLAYVVIEDFPLAEFGNRIPNFTFEVTRKTAQRDAEEQPVESLVKSVMLIPGSGEFVYDTQANYKLSGADADGTWLQTGFETPLNQHTPEGKTNVLVALDQMQQTFPNLEWVGVVVNWFGTSMDIADCEIWPSVEYQSHSVTSPLDWSVAGLNRATARQIGSDDGKLRYGGTPDDGSIVRLCAAIRARGLKVFFYPMVLMDVPGKPWRGLLTGSSSHVADFFTKAHGYHAFIQHYATLLVGKVDAFAIGSELRDLTAVTSDAGVFPAVTQLVDLASTVKGLLGSDTKVTYAADWTEYHHSGEGWYHLDPLWASSAIDMVGIDAYFPLTDETQTGYDLATIREGWRSGEGYDWYYTDEARTTKAPLEPAYAWKNIDYWWRHTHTNPDDSTTSWVPESKPIWFTEYGFASVDGCTNQPNVFVDASTGESAYPRFSRGRVDFMAQRTAIAATEAEWADSSMVPQRFLWSWDARPYPYWPDLRQVWTDGGSWVTGHWVQGKLGTSHVAAVVEEMVNAATGQTALVDASALQIGLDGFILAERTSARAALEQLMQAYFFTLHERDGKLVALPRRRDVLATVKAEDCLPLSDGERDVAYHLERAEDMALPALLEVHSLNRLKRYEAQVQVASRGVADAHAHAAVRFALVLSETHGRAVAENMLTNRWAERSQITLQLPMRFATLEPGDVLNLMDGTQLYRLRVQRVQIGRPGLVRVYGVLDASDVWDGYIAPTIGGDGSELAPLPATRIEIFEIPALPGDAPDILTLWMAACGTGQHWPGASMVLLNPSGEDQLLAEATVAASMGACVTALPVGTACRFDRSNTVTVALLGDATLSHASEVALLNGANLAVIGNELVQFAGAELIAPQTYQLHTLLRGRQGTEHAMVAHQAGERFVLLNDAVMKLPLATQTIGQQWNVRAVTLGMPWNEGNEMSHVICGESLKPLAPVRIKAVRNEAGDVHFSWLRRARVDSGLRDYVDIPLIETQEIYDFAIVDGDNILRLWSTYSPNTTYAAADQETDFGSLQAGYAVKIHQRSTWVGPGNALLEFVWVE